MHKWLFNIKKNKVKPSSFETYETTYRLYISNSKLAHMNIINIRSLHIQELYNNLFSESKSVSKVRKTHKLLVEFFKYLEVEGYSNKNYAKNTSLPKSNIKVNDKEKIKYFNLKEIEELKDLFKNTRYYNLILIALGTGLRQGELFGLTWKYIYLKDKKLYVNHSLNRVAEFDDNNNKTYKTILGEPKSKPSYRYVDIPDNLITIFKQLKKESINDFVFSFNNEFIHKYLQKDWKKIITASNIEYKPFHALRHTYATLLLSRGVNVNTVKELMGHSSIKITEVYLHVLPESKEEAVNKLNDIFKTK